MYMYYDIYGIHMHIRDRGSGVVGGRDKTVLVLVGLFSYTMGLVSLQWVSFDIEWVSFDI